MTEKIFLDAYAWIEIFEETEKGQKILRRIKDHELYTPILNYYEVLLKYRRQASDISDEISVHLKGTSIVTPATEEIMDAAVGLKLRHPQLSMADATAFATAIVCNGILITGDRDFKDIKHKNVEYFK